MTETMIGDDAWLAGIRAEFADRDRALLDFRERRRRGDISGLSCAEWPSLLLPRPIPKIVWMYWAQGWEKAPDIVHRCRETWIESNPDWDIKLLDDDTAGEFHDLSGRIAGRKMSLNHQANFLRMNLLLKFGGVWADATTVCTRPLDHWLPVLMQSGFFAFSNPRPDRPLANWFLASERNGVVMARWLALCDRYWDHVEDAEHYFWMHYLFAYGCRTDPTMAAGWASTPHLSAHGALQPSLLKFSNDDGEVPATIAARSVPVYKLSHKNPPGSRAERQMALFFG